MWTSIRHPSHREFYEELHHHRSKLDEDWLPMVRAIQHLQSLTIASGLYAFTSLHRFHLTSSPSYAECDGHCYVSIIWRFPERRFDLAFGSLDAGWVNDQWPQESCDDEAFAETIQPFIERLLASPSSAQG